MTPSRALFTFATVSMLALFGPTTQDAFAQGKPPAASKARPAANSGAVDKVDIQLMVVHAKEGKAFVDPKLKPIERHLRMLRYDNFRVLQTDRSTVGQNKKTTFNVQGGRKVSVTVLSANSKAARLKVQVFKQGNKLVETTISVNRGSTVMVAGPKYEGGILILPITASY